MENVTSEKSQIESNKKLKTCSNCLHRKACTLVYLVGEMPVDKFVLLLKAATFYEGINKTMAENCFHFENENTFTKPEMLKALTKYPVCERCNDQYWIYDDNGQRIGGCECHN